MDEQARRYYDYITNGLKAESPEGIFTRAQIDQAGVFMWGNAQTSIYNQCEAELERVELTISDRDERIRAAENINDYYVEKEVAFNRAFDVAIAQLYRENGIAIEEPTMSQRPDDPQEKRVKLYTEQQHKTDQRTSEQINADGGKRGGFITKVEQLPTEREGTPELPNRTTPPSHLTPKPQPPTPFLSFMQAPIPAHDQNKDTERKTDDVLVEKQHKVSKEAQRDIPGRIARVLSGPDDLER